MSRSRTNIIYINILFVLNCFLFGQTAHISITDSILWKITIDDSLQYITGDTVLSIAPGQHDLFLQPINNRNWMIGAQSREVFVQEAETLKVNYLIPSFKIRYLLQDESYQNKTNKLLVRHKKRTRQQKYIKPVLLTTAIAANWASFYIKRKADDYYDIYRETSNLDRMEKYYSRAADYDVYANILLGVSAAALTAYFYYLMTD